MDIPITLGAGTFPSSTFEGSVQDFAEAIAENFEMTVPETNLILGKVGGSAPGSDVGPWADDRVWKAWDGAAYKPMKLAVGNATDAVFFEATPTANRTQTLQDKSGTLALTSDIYNPRNSVNLATAPVPNQMDWSTTFSFFISISGNTDFTITNSLPGQRVVLVVTATGSVAANFPDTVVWPGGTAPSQTADATDVYILENIAGTIYGEKWGSDFQ